MCNNPLFDEPLKDFAERLVNMFEAPRSVIHNYVVRDLACKTLNSLALIQDVLVSAAAAFDEWVSKKARGKEESSSLCRALGLHENARALEGLKCSFLLDGASGLSISTHVTLELGEECGMPDVIGSYERTCKLLGALAALPIFKKIKPILQASLQMAVSKFVAALLPSKVCCFQGRAVQGRRRTCRRSCARSAIRAPCTSSLR
jgi:hypothetical protein